MEFKIGDIVKIIEYNSIPERGYLRDNVWVIIQKELPQPISGLVWYQIEDFIGNKFYVHNKNIILDVETTRDNKLKEIGII